jgi:hypothetical protein
MSWPETSKNWVLNYLAHLLQIIYPFESIANRQTADFNWDLYQFDTVVQGGHLYFDIALAQRESSVYMVALVALKDEFRLLHSDWRSYWILTGGIMATFRIRPGLPESPLDDTTALRQREVEDDRGVL